MVWKTLRSNDCRPLQQMTLPMFLFYRTPVATGAVRLRTNAAVFLEAVQKLNYLRATSKAVPCNNTRSLQILRSMSRIEAI